VMPGSWIEGEEDESETSEEDESEAEEDISEDGKNMNRTLRERLTQEMMVGLMFKFKSRI